MNSSHLLLLISLITIWYLSIPKLTKAELTSDTILNTLAEINLNTNFTCNSISQQSALSKDDVENRLKIEKNINNINQKNINADIPQASIWWAAEQFDPFDGNLVQNWLTHPHKQQISLTVNWQLWTLLDYFGRYRFVNQFGTVVRKHGYSLNIFSQKEQCLATYRYNTISNPPKWEIYLEKSGRDSLEVETSTNQDSLEVN